MLSMDVSGVIEARRPDYDIYFEAEPLVGRIINVMAAILSSSACASFLREHQA
jgi:hypothetical protein